ncbi:MAG TPA: hypothetical protein PKE69_28290 [Pyrinomonadaceae bacterium]|nr:hypothetical protein [Pyrinomonadaceae bacterium]
MQYFIKTVNPRNNTIWFVKKERWEARGKSKRYGAVDRLAHLERVSDEFYLKSEAKAIATYISQSELDIEYKKTRALQEIAHRESIEYVKTSCNWCHHSWDSGLRGKEYKEGFRPLYLWHDMHCDDCRTVGRWGGRYKAKLNYKTGEYEYTVALSDREQRALDLQTAREALQKAFADYSAAVERLKLDKAETRENKAFIKSIIEKKP